MLTFAAAALIAICPPPPARRETCVHDGDTIWWQGEKIRIAAIDAPELDAADPRDAARAAAARARLVQLIGDRDLTVERLGHDCYGRTLAYLVIDGRRVGDQLVAEGHARRWTGPIIPTCRS